LCQFLKLAAENVVHRQLLRDFPGDVDVMSPPRVQVRFLQQNDVRLFAARNSITLRSFEPRSMSGVDPRSGKKHTFLHAPTFIACMHIAVGSPSPPVLNRSGTHRSLREYFP